MIVLLNALTIAYGVAGEPPQLEELLRGIARGEREALARLYEQTRVAVYGLALSYLKNAHDAQDVTQDTFVRIWDSAHQYCPQGTPMAWILTVTRNLALMQLRRSGRHQELDGGEWDAVPANAPGVTPEDRAILQTALTRLSDRERQVVMLHAVAGLKHRETASLLRIPLPTALSLYHRALKKLKVELEGDDIL